MKLLALEPAHRLHRERVVDALWPDVDPEAGRNNLHQVVHAARSALSTVGLDRADALGMHDDLVVLGPGCVVVTDLEELSSAVRAAESDGDHDALTAALDRWPGDLLPEDVYEPWAQACLSGFREWRSRVVMDLVEARLQADDPELAVSLLAPVVSADPLHEPAQRSMMRALSAAGRRSEALLVFERLRRALRDELAADPEPETRQLLRALLADQSGAAAAEIPRPRDGGNLPAPVTRMVGRDRELAETAAILARTRLLTLTGTGGAGKTTLAVELARRRTPDYAGGVHLVELAAVADGELVVPEIARSLQVQLPSDAHPLQSLVGQLRDQQLLLVLDNCEHLLETCARIVSVLLRSCPGVSVLATSREALRIEGEISWRTPSLALPDPARSPGVQELAAVAAVQLFVERATAVARTFELTEENATAVAEICYRLDGMPLALELAAACIPALAPQQIAERLGSALTLLRRGDRATITRQQTLEATLAWSYDLLLDDERVLLRRLAVFAGHFTLDAVDAVCGHELGQERVLAALTRLVDTSLLVAEVRGAVTRYRLLETVHQYATRLLRAAGEQAELRRAHCEWYLRFAIPRDPEGSPAPEASPASQASLDLEHDNLRTALSWALRHRPEAALQLAVALWPYWLARGFFAEGGRWLGAALAAHAEPTALRARALPALAVLDVRRGSGERLAELGAEAVAIARAQDDDPDGLAQALHADAVLAYMRGSWTECWQRTIEAREAATAGGAGQVRAASMHLQAVVLMGRGELLAARAVIDEVRLALPEVPRTGRPFFPPVMLGFAVEGTRTASPRAYFEETVLLGRHVGTEQAAAYVLCNLADLDRLAGELDEPLALLDEAVARFEGLDDVDGQALALSRLGCLHRVRGELPDARAALSRSLRLRRAVGDLRAIGITQANLGVLTAAEGDVEEGCALIERAAAGFAATEDEAGRVGLSLTVASVLADAGAFAPAGRRLAEVLPASGRVPANHRATGWGYAMLGDIERRLGREEAAERASRRAGAIFDALGCVDGVAHVRAQRLLPQSHD
ncbi:MAG: ATP-binding protein [Frankiaceae bacterium]